MEQNFKPQLEEVKQAISAGEKSLSLAHNLEDKLKSAKNWGFSDILGGGMLSGVVKHNKLEDAQIIANELQSQLKLFNSQSAGITIDENIEVSIDDLTKTIDIWWNDVFTNVSVYNKTKKYLDKVRELQTNIKHALERLYNLQKELETKILRQ
ncbi:MAG: hypothetical protein ATN35_00685 [Epulopiscium sp. Nele67-Bin004]|nr:MAG: hypothetical protein ATN35_00685 [Epulopiscium sp. Nele67-Bin004]